VANGRDGGGGSWLGAQVGGAGDVVDDGQRGLQVDAGVCRWQVGWSRVTTLHLSVKASTVFGGPLPGRAWAPAQRSEIATCSSRSICCCMPTSIPVAITMSRASLLVSRTSSESTVRPSTSVKVTTFSAGSPSGKAS
jgi:hypothetical protein